MNANHKYEIRVKEHCYKGAKICCKFLGNEVEWYCDTTVKVKKENKILIFATISPLPLTPPSI